MEFWDNVSVNLFSNVIWVVGAYGTMQFVKRTLAAPPAPPTATQATNEAPATSPTRRFDGLRRMVRATFDLAGLLVGMLLICSVIVGAGPDVRWHVAGWAGIAALWGVWSWATRDPRVSVWRRQGDVRLRVAWAVMSVAFWGGILWGLIYLVYQAP